jgi:glycosyltransferase involved in cell wall biosynthesis
MRLSVVIPCYNERGTVRELIERVEATPFDTEIIVVDDGSDDGSSDALLELEAEGRVRLLRHERNRGKGAAVRTGFAACSGDVALIQDADLEYDPRDYERLLAPILDGRADAVFGSRFVGGDAHRVLYFWHSIGNRALTLLSNAMTNLNLTDMECCLKAFRREALEGLEIRERRFGVEPELAAWVARRRLRVFEVGVSYAGRTYAEGKKITWRDGVRAVIAIVRHAFARR